MADERFTAVLLEGHKGAAFEVPFDPEERWGMPPLRLRLGRNGHRVAGKVNGVSFESAIVPRMRRFWVLIDDDIRERARLEIGSSARIALHPVKPVVKPAGNPDAALALTRDICLSLPDTEEKIAWGSPTFRVHGRLFVMFTNNHHGDGRIAIWCAAPPGAQQDLVAADPKHFFVPPYAGPGGWIGIRLDTRLAKGAIAALMEQGSRVWTFLGTPTGCVRVEGHAGGVATGSVCKRRAPRQGPRQGCVKSGRLDRMERHRARRFTHPCRGAFFMPLQTGGNASGVATGYLHARLWRAFVTPRNVQTPAP